MKKTLVAVAALVATGAFAQVTISGVMEAAIINSEGNTTLSGGTNGSEVRFGISEDLGSGMKFNATSTLLVNLFDGLSDNPGPGVIGRDDADDVVNNVNQYNSFIGLSGDFGNVKIGQQFAPNFFVSTAGDFTGRAGVSNYAAGGTYAQVANALTYTSPSISGITVSYQTVLNTAISKADGKGFNNWSATYSNGPLNIAYGVATLDGAEESVFGANYDFGVAKLWTGMSTVAGASASSFGITAPLGPVILGGASQRSSDGTANQFSIVYPMSKKTAVYLAVGNSTEAVQTTLGGIRHDF